MTTTIISHSTTSIRLSSRPHTTSSIAERGPWRRLLVALGQRIRRHPGFTPSPSNEALDRMHEARSLNR